MIEFILMLTHEDETVPQARAVYEEVRDTGLHYVGFKDIGATAEELKQITEVAHADGLEVMLEVVSLSLADELRSIGIGLDIGVDWILGGTHPEAALETVRASGARYCPFAGTVTGHPSVLEGDIAEIAEQAAMVSRLDGVTGIDLLAYRHETADTADLTRAVVAATLGPVIGAGSVRSAHQIETLAKAGAWGFTIGSAIFDGQLPGAPGLGAQVVEVLKLTGMVGL
jgi:uncharacterized protein related to proFAR isomerase